MASVSVCACVVCVCLSCMFRYFAPGIIIQMYVCVCVCSGRMSG
jgi:hypothetical protein